MLKIMSLYVFVCWVEREAFTSVLDNWTNVQVQNTFVGCRRWGGGNNGAKSWLCLGIRQ